MGHDLDAKYALAFGINLERQPAAVQLEDRQIIHRSLDRYFPLSVLGLALAIFRPVLVAHDGLDGAYVERHAAAVNQGLKDLLHVAADFKQQVAAVFDLSSSTGNETRSGAVHQARARSTGRWYRSTARRPGAVAL